MEHDISFWATKEPANAESASAEQNEQSQGTKLQKSRKP